MKTLSTGVSNKEGKTTHTINFSSQDTSVVIYSQNGTFSDGSSIDYTLSSVISLDNIKDNDVIVVTPITTVIEKQVSSSTSKVTSTLVQEKTSQVETALAVNDVNYDHTSSSTSETNVKNSSAIAMITSTRNKTYDLISNSDENTMGETEIKDAIMESIANNLDTSTSDALKDNSTISNIINDVQKKTKVSSDIDADIDSYASVISSINNNISSIAEKYETTYTEEENYSNATLTTNKTNMDKEISDYIEATSTITDADEVTDPDSTFESITFFDTKKNAYDRSNAYSKDRSTLQMPNTHSVIIGSNFPSGQKNLSWKIIALVK